MTPFLVKETLGAGSPEALQVNLAMEPTLTIWGSGASSMLGGVPAWERGSTRNRNRNLGRKRIGLQIYDAFQDS